MANEFPKGITLHYDHVGIYVSELDRSIKWYSEMLGYELMARLPFPLLEVDGSNEFFTTDIAFLQCGDHNLELYCSPRFAAYNYNHYKGELGTKHISYILPPKDYNILIDYLWGKGVKFTVGGNEKHHVKDPFEGVFKGPPILRAFILDPDGIPIEIIGRELGRKAVRDMLDTYLSQLKEMQTKNK